MLHPPLRLRTRPQPDDRELGALVGAAATGDPVALDRLMTRFDRMLRGVTRSYRLSSWDADDVVQATWLQFIQHGRTLRNPSALGGWLATTARRLSLRVLEQHAREQLSDDPVRGVPCHDAEPDRELIATEREALVRDALAGLPDRHRDLVRVLVTRPELSYAEVGRLLAMPIGSIGPTRARALDRLRESRELQALHAAGT